METHEIKIVSRLLRELDTYHRLRQLNIDYSSFDDNYLRAIVATAFQYIDRHNEPLTFEGFKMVVASKGIEPSSYLASFTACLQTSCTRGEFEVALVELRRCRVLREIQDTLSSTIDEITEKKLSVEEIAKNLRERALKVGRFSGVSYSSEGLVSDTLDERFNQLLEKRENPHLYSGSLSPWRQFNSATNGVMPGEMLVVIAESGGGKSTWMVNKSEHSFSEENKNIVYFSLEMGRRQLELRYDTRIAARMFPQLDLTYRKIRDGYMNKDEVSAYKQVIEFQREKKNHIYIVDDPTLSVDSMRDKIDRLKGEISVDEVIVDYLGLISGIEKGWEAVGRVTADLYTLARETNVPIITAGQRNNEGGVGLSYLIKAHSSIMVRINQPEELRLINEMEQEFVKNREGSTPKFTCMVNFDKMLIEDVVPVSIDE